MPISAPYYNLHQLITGQYSAGNEFVFADGTDFVGMYHITPTGQRFSGPRPEKTTREIYVKKISQTTDSLVFNRVKGSDYPKYVNPVLITPIPTYEDYNRGKIQRMFLQKRNSPLNSIIEIDAQQYNKVNTTNKPGINGVIWNKLLIEWVISKIDSKDAAYINHYTLVSSENKFPHIGTYLKNTLEFYR